MVKQDLNGHDMGTRKKTSASERDRFFVDKTDTAKTENKTLIQGSLTSSSFLFHESGGALAGMAGNEASGDSRMFTDLRLQTDFRHIGGGRWDARIDGRIRFVNSGATVDESMTGMTGPTTHVQSGMFGQNEYDLRELWLIRNGERTDLTLGRQFITDLAALKIRRRAHRLRELVEDHATSASPGCCRSAARARSRPTTSISRTRATARRRASSSAPAGSGPRIARRARTGRSAGWSSIRSTRSRRACSGRRTATGASTRSSTSITTR